MNVVLQVRLYQYQSSCGMIPRNHQSGTCGRRCQTGLIHIYRTECRPPLHLRYIKQHYIFTNEKFTLLELVIEPVEATAFIFPA